jgi:hypothetical protein
LAALLAYSSFSLSEEVFGSTYNAASAGYNWVMQNVLPQQAGLTVNNIIYRYTAEKNAEDPFVVHVQNENALDTGYIFRETDDWSGVPGNNIYKVIPVGAIPIEYWGDGSIEWEGEGNVVDPSVVYTYWYNTCFDPQTDPECPGYEPPYTLVLPVIEFNDPLQDQYVLEELERKAKIEEEEEYERKQRLAKTKKKLENLLGGINIQAMSELALSQEAALLAMNYIPPAYLTSLRGGTYDEVLVLIDNKLPVNKKARRVGLAQQLLHEEMVEAQYTK